MAGYYDDFRDATLGNPHPDIVPIWLELDQTVVSGNPLADSDRSIDFQWDLGSFDRAAARYKSIQTEGKTTVRLLVTHKQHGSNVGHISGPFLSGSGDGSTRTGYVIWAGTNFRLSKYESGGDAAVASSTQGGSGDLLTRYLEIIRDGSSVEVRSWLYGDPRPAIPELSYNDSSPLPVAGYVGVSLLTTPAVTPDFALHSIAIGTNGDPAPTGPVTGGGEEKTLSQSAAGSDNWRAQCQAPAALVSGALASDNLSTIAAVSAGIVASAQASDQAGDSPAAVGSLQSGATGNDTADALADAAASLTAGAAAGERWTVQAQVLVDLLNQAAASDSIRRAAEDARQAAITEQSQASDQFLSAIQALAELHGTARVSDVLTAVVAQLASISSGAIASDQFRTSFGFTQTISDGALAADTFGVNFGFRNALQSGALSADVWGLMVNMTAALSEVCTASDLVTALVDTRARVTAGAIATSRFAIVNAGIQYLVMGAITLRTALTSKTGVNPALNHTTNIKPGN